MFNIYINSQGHTGITIIKSDIGRFWEITNYQHLQGSFATGDRAQWHRTIIILLVLITEVDIQHGVVVTMQRHTFLPWQQIRVQPAWVPVSLCPHHLPPPELPSAPQNNHIHWLTIQYSLLFNANVLVFLSSWLLSILHSINPYIIINSIQKNL